jgi:hypothetical protein
LLHRENHPHEPVASAVQDEMPQVPRSTSPQLDLLRVYD